jgi:predicted HTH domain antitoxin
MKNTVSIEIDDSILSIMKITKNNSALVLKMLSAAALFQAKKISIGKAAEIAGMKRLDFENFLTEMGMPNSHYDVAEFETDMKVLDIK